MTAASQTDTADVVIAGGRSRRLIHPPRLTGPGGTAGSVIAARLAAARPDWQIVLIEAGPDTRDTPEADSECLVEDERPQLTVASSAARPGAGIYEPGRR